MSCVRVKVNMRLTHRGSTMKKLLRVIGMLAAFYLPQSQAQEVGRVISSIPSSNKWLCHAKFAHNNK